MNVLHLRPTAAISTPPGKRLLGTIRVEAKRIDVDLSDEEIAARVAAYQAPARDVPRGVLTKYAKLVSSAARGAVTID